MQLAKQSTARTIIIGPILDSTGAEYASAVIGDISISKNGGTLTALASAATLTYIANGQYTLVLTTGNTDTLGCAQILCNKSTYQCPMIELSILPATVYSALIDNATTAAGGLGDIQRMAGTTLTARDIGASVLLSSGTGTGQLDFTSGVVKANATQWLGGTIPAVNVTGVPLVDAKYLLGTIFSTPTVAGIPNINVKTWNDLTTVALPLVPTTDGRTLDVSIGGEAGIDWANVGTPGSTVNLSATTVATITNLLTAAQLATAIWQDTTAGDFTVSGSIGKSLYTSGVVPGGAGGLFISGSNTGTTTFGAVTVTGNFTVSGNWLTTGTTTWTGVASFGAAFTITGAITASNLTNARIGYLDNINVGGAVASQADITALNQSASRRVVLSTVQQYERPESGTTNYQLELRTYDGDGAATNADSTPTLTATGIVSGSLAANLSAVSSPATGVYRATYSVTSAAVLEQIRFDASATIAASAFTIAAYAQVLDFVSSTWTTTDASNLTAIFNKLPTNNIGDQTLLLAAIGTPMQAGSTVVLTDASLTTAKLGTFVLAKTTNITGFNDIAATAIVSSGAITTSGGAVVTVSTLTGNTPQTGDAFARLGAPSGASIAVDIAAVKTDTGNLVTRITSTLFSGITSLAQWLGMIAGKQVGNTTARTEVRATGAGSGTFDETTDAIEAIRDRGDAAWITGGGGGGTGPFVLTLTIDDGASPLEGVLVRVKNGATNNYLTTNASGVVAFNVAAGTWTIFTYLSGYQQLPSGTSLAVSADTSHTYSLTASTITPSSPGQTTGFLTAYDNIGVVDAGVKIYCIAAGAFTGSGVSIDTAQREATSNGAGLVQFSGLFLGMTYQFRRGDSGQVTNVKIPATAGATYELPAVIGTP